MSTRRADREAEGARLLSEYTPQGYLGFESPALRHLPMKAPQGAFFHALILDAYRPAGSDFAGIPYIAFTTAAPRGANEVTRDHQPCL